jgi:hypothetical protein
MYLALNNTPWISWKKIQNKKLGSKIKNSKNSVSNRENEKFKK